jgi:hypothetical protein
MRSKPPPKRRRIPALDPEAYGILQRNLTTLMPAQVTPESFNTSYLFVHEIGELLLCRHAPFGFGTYACLTCHNLIFSSAFGNFVTVAIQLNLFATAMPNMLQGASL